MAEIKNAIVVSVALNDADRGMLTAWLHLDYGGSVQSFGGHALYLPESFSHHKLESPAGHFIWRCMEIAGVTDWHKIAGKTVRVRIVNGLAQAIGHIVKDDWFDPGEDFKRSTEGKT